MNCPNCGSIMVEKNEGLINCGNPPSSWMICNCGNCDLKFYGTVSEKTKTWQERWKEANEVKDDGQRSR
jgi:hypothetical protein